MVRFQFSETTIDQLKELLSAGDVVIDGGNSRFSDDPPRAQRLGERGIGYLDAGVSGGVWGLENGYALMVGGQKDDAAKVQPIFDALKPPAPVDEPGQEIPGAGFVPPAPPRAGHSPQMVHNGLESQLMQS